MRARVANRANIDPWKAGQSETGGVFTGLEKREASVADEIRIFVSTTLVWRELMDH